MKREVSIARSRRCLNSQSECFQRIYLSRSLTPAQLSRVQSATLNSSKHVRSAIACKCCSIAFDVLHKYLLEFNIITVIIFNISLYINELYLLLGRIIRLFRTSCI